VINTFVLQCHAQCEIWLLKDLWFGNFWRFEIGIWHIRFEILCLKIWDLTFEIRFGICPSLIFSRATVLKMENACCQELACNQEICTFSYDTVTLPEVCRPHDAIVWQYHKKLAGLYRNQPIRLFLYKIYISILRASATLVLYENGWTYCHAFFATR